jgi:hypothetical protein
MNHPYFASENAKARYDSFLQAAENHRRIKKLKRNDLGPHTPIRSILGTAIKALDGWLTVHARTNTKVSTVNE